MISEIRTVKTPSGKSYNNMTAAGGGSYARESALVFLKSASAITISSISFEWKMWMAALV